MNVLFCFPTKFGKVNSSPPYASHCPVTKTKRQLLVSSTKTFELRTYLEPNINIFFINIKLSEKKPQNLFD